MFVVFVKTPFVSQFAKNYEVKELLIYFNTLQVSNQCMALVRDDCLVPTIDAPELGYIRESTSEQYVPDILYKVGNTRATCTCTRATCTCIWLYCVFVCYVEHLNYAKCCLCTQSIIIIDLIMYTVI